MKKSAVEKDNIWCHVYFSVTKEIYLKGLWLY